MSRLMQFLGNVLANAAARHARRGHQGHFAQSLFWVGLTILGLAFGGIGAGVAVMAGAWLRHRRARRAT